MVPPVEEGELQIGVIGPITNLHMIYRDDNREFNYYIAVTLHVFTGTFDKLTVVVNGVA